MRTERENDATRPAPPRRGLSPQSSVLVPGREVLAFRRGDGRVGIRNHVAAIAAADMANPSARRLAAAVPGALAITALYGRGQLGEDYEQTVRTLAGLGANPNV